MLATPCSIEKFIYNYTPSTPESEPEVSIKAKISAPAAKYGVPLTKGLYIYIYIYIHIYTHI